MKFADSKLTPQHRRCYCSLPAGNAWYLTCQTTNKCNAEMMGYAAQFTEILRTRTVCPAEAGSGSGSGTGAGPGAGASGSGSGGSTVNVPTSGATSRNVVASSVSAFTAAAAVFAALL